jgi:hypothetical protein
MLAALLANLESVDSVPAKQRKGKRPYGPPDLQARARTREQFERDQALAAEMQAAIERLKHMDVPGLNKAADDITSRYTRRKVSPIRPGIDTDTYVDYADMAKSAMTLRKIRQLEEWADEEDILLLLIN